MRVLRVRLTNLNSLKGTHELDLTSDPLASAGLFVITGPTGAGKTTLLDAITLALFGKAARYGAESHPEHVMTRRCGECSAEVEFEVPAGMFRAVWQRRRARKKPDGALQPAKRYIYDAQGQPITQQIREAEEKVVELLGLNYDRFLRSVLLAQGDFAKFLKAKANERAEVLESLTGTVIYSQLGVLAQAESGRREKLFEAKQTELDLIEVLSEEDRSELENEIAGGEKRNQLLGEKIEAGADVLTKIDRLQQARAKEGEASQREKGLVAMRDESRHDLQRLQRHQSTLQFADALADLDSAESGLKTAVSNRERANRVWAAERERAQMASEIFSASVSVSIVENQRSAKQATETIRNANASMAGLDQWLQEHDRDAELHDRLGEVDPAVSELKIARRGVIDSADRWRQLTEEANIEADSVSLDEGQSESRFADSLDGQIEAVRESYRKVEVEVKAATESLRLRRDHLEKARLVQRLESHRHELVDGEPCPLCGSENHPWAEDAAPDPEIELLQDKVREAESELETVRRRLDLIARVGTKLADERARLIDRFQLRRAACEHAAEMLADLQETVPAAGKEDELLQGLRKRERAYRECLKQKQELSEQIRVAELNVADALSQDTTLREMLVNLLPEGQEQLTLLPDENLPDVPEAMDLFNEASTSEAAAVTKVEERKRVERNAIDRQKKCQERLLDALAGSEFESIEALRGARLESETAERLTKRDREINDGLTAARAVMEQARRDITQLLAEKALEGEVARAWKAEYEELKREARELIEQQTIRRNRLQTDDANRKARRQVEQRLESELKELTVWKRLRELIGSHDGAKFRRYAQAISLDILTRRANRHLAELSDRYQIRRDRDEPLNLLIEDLHQAGVRRPMASLSGGESFLASLALALGLSEVAGRNVRIDSLFIDEGFGSLDPDTLEVAIAALESLRQDDKTVGLISHVEALKERIHTQIVVEKRAGGFSTLRVVPSADH